MVMSRRTAALVLSLALPLALLSLAPTAANAKGLAGKPCPKAGVHRQTGGKEYVCAKRKGKLVWVLFSGGGGGGGGIDTSKLPLISTFDAGQPHQSDRLPADMSMAEQTVPYLGANMTLESPHQGIHVTFSNADGRWTSTGGASNPSAYPAIYAVADGIVTHIDAEYQNGPNTKTQIQLAFAKTSSGQAVSMGYSIEPMVPQPSPGFLTHFVNVKVGQAVHKGDVLAWIYVPPTSNGDTHLHMEIDIQGNNSITMQAPAIFTPGAVADFVAKFGDRGGFVNGVPLAPCMAIMVAAPENPFGTGASDGLDCAT